jgi:Domain of unknown function (DUF4384)
MLRRWLALSLALAALAASPAVLPSDWTDAHAKRARSKSAKSQSAKSQKQAQSKKSEPRANEAPAASSAAATTAAAPGALRTGFVWPLNLTLTTDRKDYAAGDLMTVAVVPDAACDLTLISIDGDGFATVLFPNEFEPDNQLNAGVPVTIPRLNAAYQLRVKRPGIETLLGVCSPPGSRPRGIVADYERYRFTLLGDWADFTATIEQREEDIVKASAEAQRKRSKKAAPLPPLLPSSDPSTEGRTVLLIGVGEAP